MSLLDTLLDESCKPKTKVEEGEGAEEEVLEEDFSELFDEAPTTYFCEGVDGLFQISADSEMAWGNLMQESIAMEHVAIMNEDKELLSEADDKWYQKVVEWVKEKARKLKEYFKALMTRIQMAVMNVDKVIKTYSGTKAQNCKVIIYDWKSSANLNGMITFCAKAVASVGQAAKVEKTNADAKDLLTSLKLEKDDISGSFIREYRSAEAPKEREVSASEADKFFTDLKAGKGIVGTIKTAEKESNAALQGVLNSAKREGADKTSAVTYKKELSSILDRLTGAGISVCMSRLSDALKVTKASRRLTRKNKGKESNSTALATV